MAVMFMVLDLVTDDITQDRTAHCAKEAVILLVAEVAARGGSEERAA